ncbi:hypothetical protein Rru_A1874 [Rhodospirillum rubrum ATCC 11170]|uniref:Uncharacterized protein n=1 Tax=Rhodospirillum rubrum (strain ATCC 11170 / ATH 1.1.1 / DSM 467 / LMG 4362 / NCIMB 8255 / S1) TaxID=269796 RepID=Q2RT71_RHORT|nr:hypothetical protein Rru_A1874 [Rhodospirillum rubrum ATCC 11170]MBK5954272.1 hypothetical protein [Rhodospirillum rubrum]HCF17482.1 hypothetical protein [Rhodospirillum rubrum]
MMRPWVPLAWGETDPPPMLQGASHKMTASLDHLTKAEHRAIEDLFLQEITGRPAGISRRVGRALIEKGLVEETVFIIDYKPTGPVTRDAFRLTPIGHFRYCQWSDRRAS